MQNVKEISKKIVDKIEDNEWNKLGNKLMKDSEIEKYARKHLAQSKSVSVSNQKQKIIQYQRSEFKKNYGRNPIYNDEDYEILKRMTIDRIKVMVPGNIKYIKY